MELERRVARGQDTESKLQEALEALEDDLDRLHKENSNLKRMVRGKARYGMCRDIGMNASKCYKNVKLRSSARADAITRVARSLSSPEVQASPSPQTNQAQ